MGTKATNTTVRLTRRGRVVAVAFLALVAAVAVMLLAPASEASGPRPPKRVVIVESGDTLWSLAQQYAPGADPMETVARIRRLNNLSDSRVWPGQRLVLPSD